MRLTFSSSANENKRNLSYSVRFPLTVFAVAFTYAGRLRVQPHEFVISVVCAAGAILPVFALHVGETLCKAVISILGNILGALLGWGLGMLSDHEIRKANYAFLLPVVFLLIIAVMFVRSALKKVKDKYDYGPTAFLLAMLAGGLDPLGPDNWLPKKFGKNAETLGIAYAIAVLLAFLPPFFAGDEVHYKLQENIDSLACIFKGLYEECFGEKYMHENLQDEPFLQPVQSLIDSMEKQNSLSKFLSWELPWRHLQKQYEKIGDLSRCCASVIKSLSTYLTPEYSTENLHVNTQLKETCRQMCSESEKALAQLSLSMKYQTAPPASTYIHVKIALNLAIHLKNTQKADDVTSRLVESVRIIEKLAISINELVVLMPFIQFEQDSNVPENVTGSGSPQHFIPAIQQEVANIAIDINPPDDITQSRIISAIQQEMANVATDTNPHADTTQSQIISAIHQEVAHIAIDTNPQVPHADTTQSGSIPAIQLEVAHIAIDTNPLTDTSQSQFMPPIQQEVAHVAIDTTQSWFVPVISRSHDATRTNQLEAPIKKSGPWRFDLMKKFKIKRSSISDEPDTTQLAVNLVHISNSEPHKEEVAHVAIDIHPPSDTTQFRFIPAILHDVATRTNQLATPMKKSVSRRFSLKKKIKLLFVSNGRDTTQPHVNIVPISNSEPQKKDVARIAIDIKPPTDTTPSKFIPSIPQEMPNRTNQLVAPIKKLFSRPFALKNKFKVKHSSV